MKYGYPALRYVRPRVLACPIYLFPADKNKIKKLVGFCLLSCLCDFLCAWMRHFFFFHCTILYCVMKNYKILEYCYRIREPEYYIPNCVDSCEPELLQNSQKPRFFINIVLCGHITQRTRAVSSVQVTPSQLHYT